MVLLVFLMVLCQILPVQLFKFLKNSNLNIQGNSANEELTTPTGACILVNLTNIPVQYYPSMNIDSIGYGAGQKDF